jgi:hypothetical protein
MATRHTWKVGRVTRKNAGGNLYNAVRTDTGAECPLEPSHSADAIGRRVDMLNAHTDRVRRAQRTTAYRGFTIAPNGDAYSYRGNTWDMWSPPYPTTEEARQAIDAELAGQSTGEGK